MPARAKAKVPTGLIAGEVKNLQPAYFSIVMASGIVDLACHFEVRIPLLVQGLGWLNVAFFLVLTVLTVARFIGYPRAVLADVKDFNRGPGFFSIVAATAILGNQVLTIFDRPALASVLWFIAIPLWVCCMYAIFTEFTINEHKPSLKEGMNGSWLISVVATQATADLGARLSIGFPADQNAILFLALAMWLAAGMLYLWLISLIFYRFTFFRFEPKDFIPPFWINMGAMASSTLTGSTLIAQAPSSPFLGALVPFLKGFTIFFWATATWWIPMLAILAFWEHVIRKFDRAYTFLYWEIVFPIGMYTTCSYRMSQMVNLPFLMWIPRCLVYVALIAWLITFASMLRSGLQHRSRHTT